MSVYDLRHQAYQAGEAAGKRDERRRICAELEDIVGAADAEPRLLALIDQLQAGPAGAAAPLQASDTQPAGDLGDRVVAAMQARRAGKVDQSQAIADAQGVRRQQPKGDLGDQVVAVMRERRGQAGAR